MGSLPKRIFSLYSDGFRQMTVGRTLWAVIIVKLVIIFGILKWLFFPDFLASHAPDDKPAFVAKELIDRGTPP